MKLLMLLVLFLAAPATLAQGYVAAEGGGLSGQPMRGVFSWMLSHATDSATGKPGGVVIIGAVPLEGEDERAVVFKELGAAWVTPLVVTKETADTQETHDVIAAARAVFIRGGDQGRYVSWWKGTRTELAIRKVYERGGVVGGTSAGCAVLGEVTYDALKDSLLPRQILRDARHENLSLTKGFLGLVPGVLFDTHFAERGRIARLPVMLCRAKEDFNADLLGIGVNPSTAFCVSPDGTAEVIGAGCATILALTPESRTVIEAGKPPTVTNVAMTQLAAGCRYNIKTRSVTAWPDGMSREVLIEPPSPPATVLTIRGSHAEDAKLGRAFVPEKPPEGNGHWPAADGDPKAPNVVIATRFCDGRPEHRIIGITAEAVRHPGRTGLALDEDVTLTCDSSGLWTNEPGSLGSVIVLDTRGLTHAIVLEGESPRPVCAGAVLHLLGPGWAYDQTTGRVLAPQ